jgi:hypothetical protein
MLKKRTVGAKKSVKKRKSSKARGKKKHAALTPGIGVVSTIKYTQDFKDAFRNGVNDSGVTIKFKEAIGYRQDKLIQEIGKFNRDNQIGLIATVGGLTAYKAADIYAAINPGCKPFISLIGGLPTPPGPKFYGGVSLQSYLSNGARVTYLGTLGHSASQVCLFYNPNSATQAAEIGSWPAGAANPVPGGLNANGENDSSTYGADFGKIPAGVTAVVVSADAFFQDTMGRLIQAANGSNKYVCYPLQDYINAGGTPPTSGRATLYGPALSDAYLSLGQGAARVLATSNPLNPLLGTVPDVITPVV